MGMVHHPDFPETPYIYLMYTYTSSNGQLYNRVSRFTDQGNQAAEAGSNFGWPDKIGYFEDGEYANPLIMWEETVPPSGMIFYRGDLYVGTLGSQSLVRIGLNRDNDEI
ncbi:Glucose / Sorbosone dehydrogenase [Halanaerobium congolense]|jgi:glucose/arabinose dehydrogenase|uniref:Glucose / Sorbosone dehydrogenase n=2 Tax=Halanaerobium congolense TaxID=54121 RepID=A0A1G6MI72_9FIRM|nr:glucose/sorbosone dehydrogenase [Halanaerobium congolense]SDC55232.1 Glucose / Sorbosone dehydrogenase [Halanaerobium congolense]SDF12392.1 Glucose / Sorbosone dehydrogenase [Halanaerobium congolense]SDH13120.1 Glucose / Sorbosone dehydrogenase [Halanaerobium congolense]SES81509.1 Glucose / Sorbosone dehydrogenase [Halanaerobium congolense]